MTCTYVDGCTTLSAVATSTNQSVKLFARFVCADILCWSVAWQAFYRGAIHGKYIVPSPIPTQRVPRYELVYKDV
jgi:hypothetical protein